jgi:hypothetical protein
VSGQEFIGETKARSRVVLGGRLQSVLYGRQPWKVRMWIRSDHVNRRLNLCVGRAIAEAVSRWLPTAAARVLSRVWSSGICGRQSGVGAGFLRALRFPLPFIPPNSPSSQSLGAVTIGQ